MNNFKRHFFTEISFRNEYIKCWIIPRYNNIENDNKTDVNCKVTIIFIIKLNAKKDDISLDLLLYNAIVIRL